MLFVVSHFHHVLSKRMMDSVSAMKAAEHHQAQYAATIKLFVTVKQLIHYYLPLEIQETNNLN